MLFDESDHARAHCRLRCEYRDKVIESSATDFFQALCDVRSLLAKDGLIPLCYGASLNVYPSGMARDMGQGGLQDGDGAAREKGGPCRYIFRRSRRSTCFSCRTRAVLARLARVTARIDANSTIGQKPNFITRECFRFVPQSRRKRSMGTRSRSTRSYSKASVAHPSCGLATPAPLP